MRIFTVLLLGLALAPKAANAQDSAAKKIESWIREHDPKANPADIRRIRDYYFIPHTIKVLTFEREDSISIVIWRDHYFHANGEWSESRTYVSDKDCAFLEKEKCEALTLAEEAYRGRYGTLLSGTMVIYELPQYSWVALPLLNGQALYDLWGNFIEERNTNPGH